jgi:N-acyl homoserine lactone hydrolase
MRTDYGCLIMIAVHRLHLTDVTPSPQLPWARPTFPVFGYLIVHPAGPIVVDTSVGRGNALIDHLYSPVHHDLDEALNRFEVRIEDVTTVISSHLHFDHCGQNDRFGQSRILVQRAEIEAAKQPDYTIAEWAFPSNVELTPIDGDHDVVAGVRIISTPGHTPGHQSVVVEEATGSRTLVCCQASWNTESFEAATLGDDGWNQEVGTSSLTRVKTLSPHRVLFSHDPIEWTSPL